MRTAEEIRRILLAMGEEKNGDFLSGLLPGVPRERILGARMPALRKLARSMVREGEAELFLAAAPHRFLEEDLLHALLISLFRDYDRCLAALEDFLPRVDNWAVCDALRPAAFRSRPERLPGDIRRWLCSDHPFAIRFGVAMLMCHYLGEGFSPEQMEWVGEIDNNNYYVNMMIAWYFATALAGPYEAAVVWLEEDRLPRWTHNKTIQKAVESDRIPEERKTYLRTLRRKDGKR